jgi:predicted ATPase/class 3 adenylate cyclase
MAELPSGTVTFLFTDLEGSTRLWEAHPHEMQEALGRHDRILCDAVESHGGRVVKTTGDGLHAVFVAARDAVEAALAAQRSLVAEDWMSTGPLRVRMGVHTGEARARGGDYPGRAVNRAARLMSAAHGGQIVVSGATAELVWDALPDGVELLDLGEHRLQDVARLEHVFQLVGDGLPRAFPALRSVDVLPGNLPLPTTSFIGREAELEATVDAVAEGRLVTLTGVGGVGKTRLALEAAARALPRFRDGAWLCELAVVNDGEGVVQVIAGALGVNAPGDAAVESAIVDFLARRELLLVLDNCEHLLDAVGCVVEVMLRACAGLRVLATSREGLALGGERVLALRSLSTPGLEASAEQVAACEAVRLFVERARGLRPGFSVDGANADSVAEICRRLDGVPLAIELAAARVSAMSAAEIARRLDERFRLLTGGRRLAVDRHQTLRAAVDWSYSLLAERERMVFDRLGIFVGSFDAAAACAVVAHADIEEWDVLDALVQLVAKSMLQAEERADGTTVYSMLETLRAFARDHLEARGHADECRRRHAEHFAHLAEQIGSALMQDTASRAALNVARAEVDNMRAAVEWAVDSSSESDLDFAVRIVASLGPYGLYAWLADPVLPHVDRAAPGQRARVLGAAAMAASQRGDSKRAAQLLRQIVDSELSEPLAVAVAHVRLADVLALDGNVDEGLATLDHADAQLGALGGSDFEHAVIETTRAELLGVIGVPEAYEHAAEALRLARASTVPIAVLSALAVFASVSAVEHPDEARAAAEECIARQRDGMETSSHGRIVALAMLLRVRAGDTDGVLPAIRDAIQIHHDRGQWSSACPALRASVGVLEALGHFNQAAIVYGCGHAGPPGFGRVTTARWAREQEQAAMTRVRDALGDVEYDRLFSEAEALAPHEAVDRGLAVLASLIQ